MIKHIIKYLIVVSCGITMVTSCYEDKSTYPASSVGEVVIDATVTPEVLYAGYLEELTLAPGVSVAGGGDTGLLQYEWAVTEFATNDSDFETVSKEKELHMIVNRPVASTAYTVMLTVTDTGIGGLQYFHTWKMYVQSVFLDGLLVCDTHDGQASDFTYIKNSTFTDSYTGEEKIYRNILAQANGTAYNGLLSSLTYEALGTTTSTSLSHTNQVWALTPEGYCVRFDCEDFSINGDSDNESLLVYKPEDFKFFRFFKGNRIFFAITTHGIYSFDATVINRFSWYDPVIRDASISNHVTATNSSMDMSYNHTVFLDERAGKFWSYSRTSSPVCETYLANSVFDPNAMQDKTAVTAGITEDGSTATFLLKDKNTGEYTLYTLRQYQSPAAPASAGNMYTIPLPGKTLLDKAISVFFSQKDLVMYVATEEGIYAVTYGSGDAAVVYETARFVTAGEKITKARLYQQGQYVNDIAVMVRANPVLSPLPWNNKAVIVATQRGEFDGKVYVVPVTQPGIGTMDASQALVFEGFGKIQDVITIGY